MANRMHRVMGLAAGTLIVRLALATTRVPAAGAAVAKRPQSRTHEQRLLAEASRIETFQRTPLMLAAVRGDTAQVKQLLDHGADVKTSTPDELRSLVRSELVKWKRVVQQGKLTAD